ncbi:MAG TPA: hypothetical protein VHT25_00565 [Solirubrobacteraceae bacterium]|nr:hypothetical protein [Solirubrobacteraceae bacterium]
MRLPACALTILAALALGACGSSSRQSAGAGHTAGSQAAVSTAGSSGGDCHTVAADTLGEVGRRIYQQAAAGHGVGEAVARVTRSPALAAAISSGDAGAARAALNALLANQIARIEVLKSGRPFASAGSGPAIAPVRGTLPGGASYVLSVQPDDSYTKVAKQVTGADILLLSGSASGSASSQRTSRRLAGTIAGPPPARIPARGPIEYKNQKYVAVSLDGQVFPSGALRIVLLIRRSALRCAGSSAQTHVTTLGSVGERIYQEEAGSEYVRATLAHIEGDAAFQRAVAARDLAATRAAIVGLFAAHIHVVRVRVNVVEPSGAQRFFYDLGGPYVLAPVHGALRSAGKLVGRFSFAIQDDAGYTKLAHRFTGAEVLMRTAQKQVQGTLQPGPASVPDRGAVSYEGHDYQAYSFVGEAFPSGPLRISLLVAQR